MQRQVMQNHSRAAVRNWIKGLLKYWNQKGQGHFKDLDSTLRTFVTVNANINRAFCAFYF